MKGVPLPVVQQWMGHSSIVQTMTYAHLSPTTLFNAALAMDDWNGGDTLVSLDASRVS
jgi:integrase